MRSILVGFFLALAMVIIGATIWLSFAFPENTGWIG